MDCLSFQSLDFWYPILFCVYLMSCRKVFVLQMNLRIPPFIWNMPQPSSIFVPRWPILGPKIEDLNIEIYKEFVRFFLLGNKEYHWGLTQWKSTKFCIQIQFQISWDYERLNLPFSKEICITNTLCYFSHKCFGFNIITTASNIKMWLFFKTTSKTLVFHAQFWACSLRW